MFAKEDAKQNDRAKLVCPGYVHTPFVDKQIPEQPEEFGILEDDVIKTVMLKEVVDGEISSVPGIAEAVLFFARVPTNTPTGQSIIVSHGWFMK